MVIQVYVTLFSLLFSYELHAFINCVSFSQLSAYIIWNFLLFPTCPIFSLSVKFMTFLLFILSNYLTSINGYRTITTLYYTLLLFVFKTNHGLVFIHRTWKNLKSHTCPSPITYQKSPSHWISLNKPSY